MYTIKTSQTLALSLSEAWNFFSDPKNLSTITPPDLGFRITSEPPATIYSGLIISYTLTPILKIPISWVTEITHVSAPHYFVDEQRFGPYKFWHHQHHFREVDAGVEVTDIVHYKLFAGPLGKLIHALMVRADIEKIFAFRESVLDQKFSSARSF